MTNSIGLTRMVMAPTIVVLTLTACQTAPQIIKPPELHQKWELQAGDRIGGYEVISGLGELSLELQGKAVYAPVRGKTSIDARSCVYFESPEIPNYQFRLCGLYNPHIGALRQGEEIGTANQLRFAALRQHPSGKWAIVEPSKQILEKILKSS